MSTPPAAVLSGRAPAGTGPRLAGVLASRPAWIVLALLAVVLLAVGSVHGRPASRASRIAYLESVIKCPSCEDLTIAQSSAATAQTLRRLVTGWVDGGRSDAWIEQQVVAHYGQSDLLVPAGSGIDVLVWALPVAAVASSAGGLAAFFWRRRSALARTAPDRSGEGRSAEHRGAPGGGGEADDDLLVAEALAARRGLRGASVSEASRRE